MPYANLSNPQTLNLYAMVSDNPETFGDLDGHCPSRLGMPVDCGEIAAMSGVEGGRDLDDQILAQMQLRTQIAQGLSLSEASENAILNSNLTAEQAIAFEEAVLAAGKKFGIDPNILVGMAKKESTFDPTKTSKTSTAAGLFQLTALIQDHYGLTDAVATGASPSAIASQTYVAANYLHDLMQDPVPTGHPSHQLEIALGYYRGSRTPVNRAIASKGGYDAMLKLSYRGETLGSYIKFVESFQ